MLLVAVDGVTNWGQLGLGQDAVIPDRYAEDRDELILLIGHACSGGIRYINRFLFCVINTTF